MIEEVRILDRFKEGQRVFTLIAGLHTHGIWSTSFCLVVT